MNKHHIPKLKNNDKGEDRQSTFIRVSNFTSLSKKICFEITYVVKLNICLTG